MADIDTLNRARLCQRVAFRWITQAREAADPIQRQRSLTIADAWLRLAENAIQVAPEDGTPALH
jgi:hypothetical protein